MTLRESSRSIAVGGRGSRGRVARGPEGAEIISSAAEEQAAAAAEALRSVEQQSTALEESQSTTQSLAPWPAISAQVAKDDGGVDQLAVRRRTTVRRRCRKYPARQRRSWSPWSRSAGVGSSRHRPPRKRAQQSDQIDKMAQAAKRKRRDFLRTRQAGGAMLAEIRLTINDLSAGITRSLETTRQSIQLIAELEEISRRVDKIVDGIAMVSIQTNMLAVSGSVEAARAGDFGKGFAVVSKNIRNLARDCGENAGRVKDIVRAIQRSDRYGASGARTDHFGGRDRKSEDDRRPVEHRCRGTGR